MKLTLTVSGKRPQMVARLIRAQAEDKLEPLRESLKKDKLVYVRAHLRIGPPKWFKDRKEWDAERAEMRVLKSEILDDIGKKGGEKRGQAKP